jgi:hypothetical protein
MTERLYETSMSQETGAEVAAGGSGLAGAWRRAGNRGRGRRLIDWLRANLFLPTASGPVGWRKIALATGCVVAGIAISLSRTVGPGSLNTIWIEDAKYLLNQALNTPFRSTLSDPISGYYQVPARLLTKIAIEFPLSWAPGIMAIFAALQYLVYGLVAYIASGPHLRSPWLRLLVAAPVCALPLAYTQSNNDLVTVQFLGLYGAFWTLLWVPGTRAGQILAPVVMFTVSFEAALVIAFAPLVVLRLIADRSKSAIAVSAVWLLGLLLQFSQTFQGRDHHYGYGHNSPWFLLRNYGARVIPRALFGESALGGAGVNYRGLYAPLNIINMAAHVALIGVAVAVVALAIILALRRFTDPNWPLAVVAGLFSLGVFTVELLVNTPVVQTRYLIAPAMLLYTVLAALLRPRLREDARPAQTALRWLPAACVAVLVIVAISLNFRVTNGRSSSPPWTSVVAAATSACARPNVVSYLYVHEWWQLSIPCGRVR